MTPVKAIRAKCLDCCCGQAKEVRECTAKKCSLYPYRMGHRPTADTLAEETAAEEKNKDTAAFFEE